MGGAGQVAPANHRAPVLGAHGASAHSATHRFITSVLGDLGAKGMPRDCHDGPLVGRRARAGVG